MTATGTPALRLPCFLYIDLEGLTAHNPLLRLVLTLPAASSGHSDGHPQCEIPAGFPARPDPMGPGCVGVAARMMKLGVWMLATIPAAVAGWTDWRSRRIPNWLTVPALFVGIAVNTLALGWAGAKEALLGAGLGLGLLLPFVLLRSLGGGDWKLVGALGAFLGPTASDHRVADNCPDRGPDGPGRHHLEEDELAALCAIWHKCWLHFLRFACPDRSCRWITLTL